MSALGVALVLFSAVCHATWNLLAKRAGSEGAAFVWLMATAGMVLWAPVAAIAFVAGDRIGGAALVAFAGSAVLHTLYFVILQRGYARGDLSVVYPVARGTGPLLASIGAIALLGERPDVSGTAGIVLISAGVFVLGLPVRPNTPDEPSAPDEPSRAPAATRRVRRLLAAPIRRVGLAYGLLTGVFIGAYTLWDAAAVSRIGVSPILLLWASQLAMATVLLPVAARDPLRIRRTWDSFRWYAIGGGMLSPLAYILVLTALRVGPVTSVAPLREVSVLLAVVFGTHLLAEGHTRRRLAAAAVIAAGAALIAVG